MAEEQGCFYGEEGKKQFMEDLAVSKAVEFVVNEAKEK